MAKCLRGSSDAKLTCKEREYGVFILNSSLFREDVVRICCRELLEEHF